MKQILILMLLMFATLTSASLPAFAAEPFTTINAEELKGMIDNREIVTVVIDSRSKSEYDQMHIDSAISLPLSQMVNEPGSLNYPKSSRLVFYCNGFT